MCGFNMEEVASTPSESRLLEEFQEAWENTKPVKGEFAVDIYTGGSFLDPRELSFETQGKLLQIISGEQRVTRILIETRPEFVSSQVLAHIHDCVGCRPITVAVGLETSDDLIRYYCINKGFTFKEFKRAADLINSFFELDVYLLLKPPFLSEKEAINDMIRSVRAVNALGVRWITLIPANVQPHTVTEILWENGYYRPPWLWSVLYLLRRVQDPIGVGGFYFDPEPLDRVHNCGNCDNEVIDLILGGGVGSTSCACHETWEASVLEDAIPLSQRIQRGYRWLGKKIALSTECLHDVTSTLENDAAALDSQFLGESILQR